MKADYFIIAIITTKIIILAVFTDSVIIKKDKCSYKSIFKI